MTAEDLASRGTVSPHALTALVVDDEAIARDGLGQILGALDGVEVLPGAGNGRDAIRAIRTRRPDVVFLDVEMPDLSGIEIVRKLQLESPATDLPIFVFVTAYSTYAIEAFNVEASDYLVKPFTDGRIARCVDRVRRLRAQIQVEQLSNAVLSLARSDFVPLRGSAHAPRRYMQRILIPHGTRTIVVPVHEIDWIGADSDYLVIHSQGKARFLRGTLGALEQDLDPDFFVRAHRSILVNVNQIVELRRDRNGSAAMILRGGTRLPVGRRRYDDMRLRLASHAVSAIGVDR